jgi:hypothetical protein
MLRTDQEKFTEVIYTRAGCFLSNVNKTKAVLQTRTQSRETERLRIGDHNIQAVDSFVHLGSCITKDNDVYIEVQRRLKLVNKAYFSL